MELLLATCLLQGSLIKVILLSLKGKGVSVVTIPILPSIYLVEVCIQAKGFLDHRCLAYLHWLNSHIPTLFPT